MNTRTAIVAVAAAAVVLAACGSDDSPTTAPTASNSAATVAPAAAPDTTLASTGTSELATTVEATDDLEAADGAIEQASDTRTFVAEVWADNWFALYVDGELVGQDSVPITTERSFNAETISFEASYPFTVAVEAKDFIETDSGLEYIGQQNQQIGDGGIIVQITDTSTGETVAVSDADWAALAIHQAPLNPECVRSASPDTDCESAIIDAPIGWTEAGFDDGAWSAATVWSESAVSPKDGYDEIDWDAAAQLIWGADLEIDNTVLLRTTVSG
ncbi:MAG: PEBP family protein [Actinomycetota bacterium]